MRRALSIILALLLAVAAVPAVAHPVLPDTITLTSDATADTGFQAEGIVARGRYAWAGSLATGTIVRANLVTGEVTTLVESAAGPAVGLALDGRGRLWVAGGPSGQARVHDTRTGEEVAVLQLAGAGTAFINDVTVTRDAAYLTDSFNAVLYRVPISRRGDVGDAEALTLGGDFELADGFNSNGIVATGSGRRTRLVLAQSTDPVDAEGSALYVVDPSGATAEAERIALRGDVSNADGLVLRGRTLYVVENQLDRIAEVRLSGDLRRGEVVRRLTDDDFATPTTATLALGALYAVNAQFAAQGAGADPATLDYEIVRVELR